MNETPANNSQATTSNNGPKTFLDYSGTDCDSPDFAENATFTIGPDGTRTDRSTTQPTVTGKATGAAQPAAALCSGTATAAAMMSNKTELAATLRHDHIAEHKVLGGAQRDVRRTPRLSYILFHTTANVLCRFRIPKTVQRNSRSGSFCTARG